MNIKSVFSMRFSEAAQYATQPQEGRMMIPIADECSLVCAKTVSWRNVAPCLWKCSKAQICQKKPKKKRVNEEQPLQRGQ